MTDSRGMTFGDTKGSDHKRFFIEELLNPIYGDNKTIVDYKTTLENEVDKNGKVVLGENGKPKKKAFVEIKFKNNPPVKLEVTRSYPQATNEQMLATTNENGDVELNMTQDEIQIEYLTAYGLGGCLNL